MARGMRSRASNEGPRAGGRGPRASTAAPEAVQTMLDELLERAVRALDELEGLFNGAKNYFSEAIDGIVREFVLKEKDISELVMLKNTMM